MARMIESGSVFGDLLDLHAAEAEATIMMRSDLRSSTKPR